VLKVSARDGVGIDALLEALDAHRSHLESAGELARRRRRADEAWALEALEVRFGSFGLDAVGGRNAVAARLHEGPLPSAFAAVRALSAEIEEALRKS
jgi:LAO/AO transport system kinase